MHARVWNTGRHVDLGVRLVRGLYRLLRLVPRNGLPPVAGRQEARPKSRSPELSQRR